VRRAKSKTPMRRCVACRESKPQSELLRFSFNERKLSADLDGRSEGRGYYLCKNDSCREAAIKRKAFNRACRTDISADEVIRVIEGAFNNN
jgi:predicted RNA-binding protein YlxR (DUF448 family)